MSIKPPSFTGKLNLPKLSVLTPFFEFLDFTEAPGMPTPEESFTTPANEIFCADRVFEENSIIVIMQTVEPFFKKLLNDKGCKLLRIKTTLVA
jgi:hypothetical protein